MAGKVVIVIKPVVTVSPRISVAFPIKTTVIVKLFEKLINVLQKKVKGAKE